MDVYISKIEIRNFRSIRALTLSPGRLAVLVGKNDSGKSNVLRALNLFFNEKTGLKNGLNFDVDHNVYNDPNRRAKQISIRLEIELPPAYRKTNGDFVVWEKRWRAEGVVYDEYYGVRRKGGPRGAPIRERVEIPSLSNLPVLLSQINFVYVPAIKDLAHFSELQASIYGIISEVADLQFRESSQDFEKAISDQLESLTTQIGEALDLRSRLALPKDLSHIFESLDFLSEGQNISLDVRGDGIKARHIPLILKFIADKKQTLQWQGKPPHTFIWGYEEPENSLELGSSVELADQIRSFLDDGISQIFLTTHSPVFYNLHRQSEQGESRPTRYYIFRDEDEDGTKQTTELSELDERMGTMALFAPLVEEVKDRIRQRDATKGFVETLAERGCRQLFVEGVSDKLVMDKALQVFAPEQFRNMEVTTLQSAGASYVANMLNGWEYFAKNHQNLPRAAGLLDSDGEGEKAVGEWNRVSRKPKSTKCFMIPTSSHIKPLIDKGFRIPVVLETLYSKDVWEQAGREGHLIDRNRQNGIISPDMFKELLVGGTLVENLDDEWAIFVRKDIARDGKTPMARLVAGMSAADFRRNLPSLEKFVGEIVDYLFPKA